MSYACRLAFLIVIVNLIACASPPTSMGTINIDGLMPRSVQGFEEFNIRAQFDAKRYKNIKIEALTVSYDEGRRNDLLHRDKDAFQLDERELAMFNQQYVKASSEQWQRMFGWTLTETADTRETIVLKATITDFYLYASIKNNEILPHKAYSNESSRMTISFSLLDASTGVLLLNGVSKTTTGSKGRGVETMLPVSSVRYWNEAYQGFRQWAIQLGREIRKTTANIQTSQPAQPE